MLHIQFTVQQSYKVAILCKNNALNKDKLKNYYIDPLITQGMKYEDFIAIGLDYDNPKKVTTKGAVKYLESILDTLNDFGVKFLLCTDGNYFKVLTKVKKVDPSFGYILDCKLKGFEHFKIALSANYQGLFANDSLQLKIDLSNNCIGSYFNGQYQEIGTNIVKHEELIYNFWEVKEALDRLHQYPSLTCDTEAFSLRHTKAGLGTIGFAWNKYEGICINVEHVSTEEVPVILCFLKKFFESYKGNIKYHNATYDIKILIYKLWMKDMLDTEGLLKGLEVLTRDFDDTKIVTYLATNNCTENKLSLKDQAHEFAGNYAQSEINDITKIESKELMHYNLVDCLSTWFVWEKHYETLCTDQQLDTYIFFKKILKSIIQMELTGMPLNMVRVKEVAEILKKIIQDNREIINASPVIYAFSHEWRKKELVKRNAALKTKVLSLSDITYDFNPNSGKQLIALLHDYLGFDVYSYTATKQPAVGGDELKGHKERTDNTQIKELLEAILMVQEGEKILNTFVSKFLEADLAPDGWHYLFGSFNLGGTKSGRLSSSNPNLQNIPSGSTYGKLIKSCFQAPEGWLFVGLDYASLEDRINTLLTKDPNKILVYTRGFDGHAYRAYHYWKSAFPDIDPESPESINTLERTKHPLRSKSKSPTFLLTYQGTYRGLMSNCGFSEQEAKDIESNYHQLYVVSDEWVQDKLHQAEINGYVTLAFGLRLRTPILHKTLLGSKFTPHQASKEAKTAGNAVSGQSYGLLNSRAGVDLQERVIASEHRLDVKTCAQIHDANYLLVRNNLECLKWLNDNLVECVEWQELPEIQHTEVKLTGNLGVFYPNWSNEIELPHNIDYKELRKVCHEGKREYYEKDKH